MVVDRDSGKILPGGVCPAISEMIFYEGNFKNVIYFKSVGCLISGKLHSYNHTFVWKLFYPNK